MYPGAGFYGIRKILLSYAKLPTFLPLPVAVQHGWQIHAHSFEASAFPPEIWVWSRRTASELEVYYPAKKIRVVGSFYYYLKEIANGELSSAPRHGSICIPPHSSHFTSTEYSVEDFACALNDLGDEFKPITVMLYYLDVNDRTVGAYEKFGFNVVSNGSLFDDNFMSNFVNHVKDKKNCIFSDLGSGVFFAADIGLNIVRIDIESRMINHGNRYVKDKAIDDIGSFCDKFIASVRKEDIVDFELGRADLLSPDELRRLIVRNFFTFVFIARSFRSVVGSIMRAIGLLERKVPLK